jgi:LmbE family N-acetylglucosaminyl deacetylase/SAM-dependent methyltransferase
MDTRFDSRDAGTPEHAWSASWLSVLPALPALSTLSLVGPPAPGRELLVVAAHPDDETLGAGGLIATAARLGLGVTVVIASNGDASHPASPTHSRARLAEIRRHEVTLAVSLLHPRAQLHFLDLPDARLMDHLDELTDGIARHLTPSSLMVTPWSGDRHPDHAACAAAGARLARAHGIGHWQFPIWAWHWGSPQSLDWPRARLRRLDLTEMATSSKQRALDAHVSQHTDLSPAAGDEAILNQSMLAHFRRPYEVFVVDDPAPASSAEYFDHLYAQQRDPWGLADRFYERRKRELLLASLPRQRFRRAFEPGCAIGLLTARLAERCDEVVAWDGAQTAIDQTVERIRDEGAALRVRVECDRIPEHWPAGQFDLIVLSEVGYYGSDPAQLPARIEDSLAPDGVLVACHWRHPAPEHPSTAADVHAALGEGLQRIVKHREGDFLLDVWTRDGVSVAAVEGIIR